MFSAKLIPAVAGVLDGYNRICSASNKTGLRDRVRWYITTLEFGNPYLVFSLQSNFKPLTTFGVSADIHGTQFSLAVPLYFPIIQNDDKFHGDPFGFSATEASSVSLSEIGSSIARALLAEMYIPRQEQLELLRIGKDLIKPYGPNFPENTKETFVPKSFRYLEYQMKIGTIREEDLTSIHIEGILWLILIITGRNRIQLSIPDNTLVYQAANIVLQRATEHVLG